MQKIAAYILERRDDLHWPETRAREVTTIRNTINAWLTSKGRKTPGASGTYDAVDGSDATFRIEEAVDGQRSWWFVQLDEKTDAGRLFRVNLSVTNGEHAVAVYLTMEIGSATALITTPVEAEPRCPKVIRQLLEMPGVWYHGRSELLRLRRISGFDEGEGIAAEIDYPGRTVPIVVVTTTTDGSTALPSLDRYLARDLAGLANVIVADAEATWALTDHLGRSFGCYGGAVRLYWPRFQRSDDPARHSLWTAQRLRAAGKDQDATSKRFRQQLRGLIMRASALSAVAPREIDEIRNSASRKAFADMKARATSLADYEEIAASYAQENDKLRVERAELIEQVAQHQVAITDLETRLQNAEAQLRYQKGVSDDLSPDTDVGTTEDDGPPSKGDVRFYKKHHSGPSHDVMLRVGDCGCNNWESAHAADKAKKGVAKLEGGRNDWSSLKHCASCTGGGMWRVKW